MITVELKIIKDDNTGLMVNSYSWQDKGHWFSTVEVGNRMIVSGTKETITISAVPYNDLDRLLAKAFCRGLEVGLNQKLKE